MNLKKKKIKEFVKFLIHIVTLTDTLKRYAEQNKYNNLKVENFSPHSESKKSDWGLTLKYPRGYGCQVCTCSVFIYCKLVAVILCVFTERVTKRSVISVRYTYIYTHTTIPMGATSCKSEKLSPPSL